MIPYLLKVRNLSHGVDSFFGRNVSYDGVAHFWPPPQTLTSIRNGIFALKRLVAQDYEMRNQD